MKKGLILLLNVFLCASINAQKIISSQPTERKNEFKIHFRHYHKDLKISDYSNSHYDNEVGKFQILKGEEEIVKKQELVTESELGQTQGKDIIFRDNDFSILSQIKNHEKIQHYIQNYDYNLDPIGQPIKIDDSYFRPEEIEKKRITNPYRVRDSEIHHNKNNNISLFHLCIENWAIRTFTKLVVLDEDLNEINSIQLIGEKEDNNIDLIAHRILDNGEVLVIVSENDWDFVYSYKLIHFKKDGSQIITDLSPAKSQIVKSQISENMYNDEVTISILSTGSKKEDDNNNGVVTAYRYNLNTNEMSYMNYGLNGKELLLGKEDKLQYLKNIKVEYLEDGSLIHFLAGEIYGEASMQERSIIIFKVNPEGEFEWLNTIYRTSRSAGKANMLGYLSYYTDPGDLEIIFNSRIDFMKGNQYTPEIGTNSQYLRVDNGVKPVRARINLESGEMDTEALYTDSEVNSFSIRSARPLDEPGKYKIIHDIGKDHFISIIDFKSNY
ncbi:hypothetical protein [Brumimicrobium aurantiacum]|uniref:Uncharacterized protein n=1 Tax=Brumimicrobium aurantiacum TaxID=1737063 RepID=A0A3E1F1D8_9FLAO|nr:hypothetical protein [Brumimicrobium aurantiacum]RFC55559.1 hypothetical protein DXU93_01105 [Brumimicrobium aurantiacum]